MHIVSSTTVYTPFRYDCCYHITDDLIVLVFPFPRLIPCAILDDDVYTQWFINALLHPNTW